MIAIAVGLIVFVISMLLYDLIKPVTLIGSYQVDTLVVKKELKLKDYPIKVEIVNSKEQSEWSSIKGTVLGIISGAIIAIFSVWLANYFNLKKEKKKENDNYKTLLLTSKNELEFYIRKLFQLSNESSEIINVLSIEKDPLIPSYSIYPKFLENSKIGLSKFYRNVEIVEKVGHCHFELSHISERLEQLKKELRSKFNVQKQIANVEGFKELVVSNIQEFKNAIDLIQNEIAHLNK